MHKNTQTHTHMYGCCYNLPKNISLRICLLWKKVDNKPKRLLTLFLILPFQRIIIDTNVMEKTCVHKDNPLITHFTRRCHKFTLAPFIVLNSGWEDKRGQVDEKEKSMDLCIKDVRFFRQFLCQRTPFEQQSVPFPPNYHWKI